MKQMTWDDYYGGFYDWSPSTQKNYTYRLSDYGSADEVWEVAQELAFQDEAFATKFLEKALAAGVRFTPEQVLEMVGTVEESVLRHHRTIVSAAFAQSFAPSVQL